ncbi:hypothetical protein [Acinetobacter indicus]|uniref:hypothetical protein n=1 Tax=Acinetobacter indicus TaxID=756892 RepID=UPI000948FE36|nr:hypothetical protein [Acinetobacter indicus]
MSNSTRDKYDGDYLLKQVFLELSPFKYFYLYLFFLVFILLIIFGSYFDDYFGITPFSQSMILASPRVKLVNDGLLIYEVSIFLIMILKYTFCGLDIKTKYGFKQYEKKYYGSEINNNRYLTVISCAITLLILIYIRYHLFIFSEGGDIRLMRGVLKKTEFIIYLYIIIGFLMNLFLFICTIFTLELSKHVENKSLN